MFTLPHNTIAYLYKEAIDMRLGMFRLQGVIALALHNKYSLHLPLYRQINELERIGLQGVSEGVLCNWVRAAADALEPVWKAQHELMLDAAAFAYRRNAHPLSQIR